MKRVLAAVHDPGGVSGLLPVLRELARVSDLQLFAGKFAQARLREENLSFRPLDSFQDEGSAMSLLKAEAPDVLLTGTSWGSLGEQFLRNVARVPGIPSVVFVDYWSNYRARWDGATYEIGGTTDRICVIDVAMKAEMASEGFPKEGLFVTGHPRLEELGRRRKIARPSGSAILFLSEPARSAFSGSRKDHPLLKIAQAFSSSDGASLLLKPHPKEEVTGALEELIALVNRAGLKAEIDRSLRLPADFHRFDYVFGYQSMGLFEAAAMGSRVFSFPSTKPGPALAAAMVRFGITSVEEGALDRQSLQEKSPARAEVERLMEGATDAVLEQVLR